MAAATTLAIVFLITAAGQASPIVYPGGEQAYYPMAYPPVSPYYGSLGGGAGVGLPVGADVYATGLGKPVVEGFSSGGGHRAGSGFFQGAGAQIANKGYHSDGAYVGDDRHVGDKVAQEGYASAYGAGQHNAHDGGLYAKEAAYGRGGELSTEQALKNGFKKGHSSSGFQTTYHKDESGKNTRFYDDDHDEGLHVGARGFGDFYGARGVSSAHQQGGQGAVRAGQQGQQHHFGSGLHADAQSRQHKVHGDETLFGQSRGLAQHGSGGFAGGFNGGAGSAGHALLGYPY